jgi:pimeloyl-ACP methyl ester carboxylesterase
MRIAALETVEVAYEIVGEDGPVIFDLHGGWGGSHHGLRPYHDVLGSIGRLVYLDYRGHGESPSGSFDNVDFGTYATDIDALREHLDVDHAILLGHSFGARVAAETAIRYPEWVSGLILGCIAPARDFDDEVTDRIRARGTAPQVVEAWIRLRDGNSSNPREDLQAIWPLYTHHVPAGASRPHESPRPADPAAVACDRLLDEVPLDVSRLATIPAPTLVYGGAHDVNAPPDLATIPLAAAIPGAEHVLFGNSAHLPYFEEPDAWFAAIRSWLDDRGLLGA